MACAVDGPVVPTPLWKLIVEVYDPAHLQATLERIALELDQREPARRCNPASTMRQEEVGRPRSSTHPVPAPTWASRSTRATTANLVAAPHPAPCCEAIDSSSASRVSAWRPPAKFTRRSCRPDGQVNVSAFLYQNLKPVLDSRAGGGERADGAHEEQRQASRTCPRCADVPTLICAYAEHERILFATSGSTGLLGLEPRQIVWPACRGLARDIAAHANVRACRRNSRRRNPVMRLTRPKGGQRGEAGGEDGFLAPIRHLRRSCRTSPSSSSTASPSTSAAGRSSGLGRRPRRPRRRSARAQRRRQDDAAHTLLGFHEPSAGTARVLGRDIRTERRAIRARSATCRRATPSSPA